MSGFLTPDARLRVFADVGTVLAGAKLNTYVTGTPSTPLATFSDAALTLPNANPVVASAGGLFGPIYLTPGLGYKLVLTDAAGNPIWTQDPILVPVTGLTAPVTVAQGGTGDVFLTPFTILLGTGTVGVHGVAGLGTAGQLLTSNGAGVDPSWQAASVPSVALTLLKEGSGTSVAAGATTVDSIAITGLTVKDKILVLYSIESIVADTALTYLRNETDALQLQTLCATGGVVTAGSTFFGSALILPRQGSTVNVVAKAEGWGTLAAAAIAHGLRATFTTVWTGAWTLGLRHNGVTATGTFSYEWAVYKVAGQ